MKISDSVAGYTTYIDLIKEIIEDKKIISTGMMKEVDRVESAIDEALNGNVCSLVSGGDAGIYAMAGLVFELCEKRGVNLVRHSSASAAIKDKIPAAIIDKVPAPIIDTVEPVANLNSDSESVNNADFEGGETPLQKGDHLADSIEIEVVPGIPALAAGASLIGAPLTHDFAVISLSDLLTPWEKIEKRIESAAASDFVIAIYNPRSKKRDWQLAKARELILKHRAPETPVGIVTSAMRENQKVIITTLKEMDCTEVGMQTILLVGNDSSVQFLDFIYTPRGYSKKYNL
ncbi:CobJ [Desulfamplus magnetovallimortis]|uniref:CobJ n=1 Tax=Desulfamplus magnetovallimortis TaxID=1246637 RepID=A0A1W1HCX6_9BACT|nr:CobJ [Desulfamplus magnetovallimortis]